jgi:translation initiation factor eIF-2B subunit epsilon
VVPKITINSSMDVTAGLTVPFDPSMNLENDQTFSKKLTVYREKDVKIGKLSQLKNVVIGAKTIIGDGAVVVNSVIGRNCIIQPGAIIRESILWDNVVVETGVKLTQSIVAEDNSLKLNHRLSERAILPPKTDIFIPSNPGTSKTFTIYGSQPPQPITEDSDSDQDEDIPISIRTST